MAVTTLGSTHLEITRNHEVQRQNNFELVINDLANSRELTLACENAQIPSMDNDIVELDYGNNKASVAGKASTQDMSVSFKDFIGADVEKIIVDWRAKVYNPVDDAIGFAADYKKSARLIKWAPDGSVERVWIVKGMWPSAVTWGTLDHTSGEKVIIEVTFKVDRCYREGFTVGTSKQG